jgi:hypothetical protein
MANQINPPFFKWLVTYEVFVDSDKANKAKMVIESSSDWLVSDGAIMTSCCYNLEF